MQDGAEAVAISQRAGPLSRGLLATGLAVTDWAYYRALREPGYLMAGVGLPEVACWSCPGVDG